MKNPITWFEIPALDYERAKKFYTEVLSVEITDMPMPEGKYGFFPFNRESHGTGGGIMQHESMKPTTDGPNLYLDGGEDLSFHLSKVEAAGGKIIQPKTSIGENGFMALFLDTEGNKMAFHSLA
jgi:predicted enzyme related to lactoylglutathione lyase